MNVAPSLGVHLPRPEHIIAAVTAGMKCAPDTDPKAKIMHINEPATEKAPAAEPPRTLRTTSSKDDSADELADQLQK